MNDPEHETSECTPVSIERDQSNGIVITWDDGAQTHWTAQRLRDECPCATCREKRKGAAEKKEAKPTLLPVLSAAEARPLTIEAMRPVGSYAYNIRFSDGHNSGIFTFDLLRSAND
ncbi:MAG: DUF971 domain-containing protein [Planctomycetota bacterium]